MKKEIESKPQFAVNPNCPVCAGIGTLSVPDYELIWSLGLAQRFNELGWSYMPRKATFCHECYANGTPKDHNGNSYPNLIDSLNYAIRKGSEYVELFASCLMFTLVSRHEKEYAERLHKRILNKELS